MRYFVENSLLIKLLKFKLLQNEFSYRLYTPEFILVIYNFLPSILQIIFHQIQMPVIVVIIEAHK